MGLPQCGQHRPTPNTAKDIRTSTGKAPKPFPWQRRPWSQFERGTWCWSWALLGPFGHWEKWLTAVPSHFPPHLLWIAKWPPALFWSTICPTFQAQLIANFLCHDGSMIYLTNFQPANKPTFVLPGGHFPNSQHSQARLQQLAGEWWPRWWTGLSFQTGKWEIMGVSPQHTAPRPHWGSSGSHNHHETITFPAFFTLCMNCLWVWHQMFPVPKFPPRV